MEYYAGNSHCGARGRCIIRPMCGRFALDAPSTRVADRFSLGDCPALTPRYNIAPTSDVLIVRHRPEVGRVVQLVRWGLVPSWAKDPSVGAKLINARAETVETKPSFRSSFARHRCLIPASGFYEWRMMSENGKMRRQPYYVRPVEADGCLLLPGCWPAGARTKAKTSSRPASSPPRPTPSWRQSTSVCRRSCRRGHGMHGWGLKTPLWRRYEPCWCLFRPMGWWPIRWGWR